MRIEIKVGRCIRYLKGLNDSIQVADHSTNDGIVRSVLKKIANVSGERVYTDMLDAHIMGRKKRLEYFDPEGTTPHPVCTIENVWIRKEGEEWVELSVNPENR